MQGAPLIGKKSHLKLVADQEGCPSLLLCCESGVQLLVRETAIWPLSDKSTVDVFPVYILCLFFPYSHIGY